MTVPFWLDPHFIAVGISLTWIRLVIDAWIEIWVIDKVRWIQLKWPTQIAVALKISGAFLIEMIS